jgi:hypothetical protein
MISISRLMVATAVLAGLALIQLSAGPVMAQGGGLDFTRFVGVGESIVNTEYARACVGLSGPTGVRAAVRIQLVGARMDAQDLGAAHDWTILAESDNVLLRLNQLVCIQADPVALIGGQQVQTGMVVIVHGMPLTAQLDASMLSIAKSTGQTVNSFTTALLPM